MDFKHIIWDFDGTLFDTYPHTARAFQIVLKREYGVSENIMEIERQMRISMANAYAYFKDKFGINDTFLKIFKEFCVLYENQHVVPYNNTHMICKFIKDQGSFNYLYSHRDSAVKSMMQKHGYAELFRDFITSEHGFPRKPDPEALEFLIEKYSMEKSEILFVGDREIDMQCARAANIKFCQFHEDIEGRFMEEEPDFSIQNYSDFYYILNSTLSTRRND